MTSSLDLHYLVKEFQNLVNSKVDQIYRTSKKEIFLQLHTPSLGKSIIRISAPDYCYIVSSKPEAKAPDEFCMHLRKKLDNSRLRKIEQIGFERIIRFDFEAKDGDYSIVAELFSTGNIILLKESMIVTATEYRKWSERTIKPKEEYKYPSRDVNFLKLSLAEFESILGKSDKESLVKSLAMDLGLGGVYAEEACFRANADKNIKPEEFKDFKKLFDCLEEIKNEKMNPVIIFKESTPFGAFPFELKSVKGKKEKFENFSAAIEKFAGLKGEVTEEQKSYLKKIEKLEKVIEEQKQSLVNLEKEIEENSKKAEFVYEKYALIKEIIDELKKAEKKFSWKEIREKLKSHKIIKDIDSKEKTVVLEF